MYVGQQRPEADVSVVFCDLPAKAVFHRGDAQIDFSERLNDLTVVIATIDGNKVRAQLMANVAVVEPGVHLISLHVDETKQSGYGPLGTEITTTFSLNRMVKFTTARGHYYYFSASVNRETKTWAPVVTDVTDLARSGALDAIVTAAGY